MELPGSSLRKQEPTPPPPVSLPPKFGPLREVSMQVFVLCLCFYFVPKCDKPIIQNIGQIEQFENYERTSRTSFHRSLPIIFNTAGKLYAQICFNSASTLKSPVGP